MTKSFFAEIRSHLHTAFATKQVVAKAVFILWGCFIFSSSFSQHKNVKLNAMNEVVLSGKRQILHKITPLTLADEPSNRKIAKNIVAEYFIVANLIDSADKDGDGIVDSLDKCPDEKGVIEYDGCPVPDSDNDGVADDSDLCPTIAGLAKYKGCLPADRDGDKINDDDDQCPDIPGVARFNGCLSKDTDGDGVDDDDDKCWTIRGTVKNFGCPESKVNPQAKKKKS